MRKAAQWFADERNATQRWCHEKLQLVTKKKIVV